MCENPIDCLTYETLNTNITELKEEVRELRIFAEALVHQNGELSARVSDLEAVASSLALNLDASSKDMADLCLARVLGEAHLSWRLEEE